ICSPVLNRSLESAVFLLAGEAHVVLRTGLHDRVPELGALRRVGQLDLVPDLRGPPRARHDHRDALDLESLEEVVLDAEDVLPDEIAHQFLRLRTLDLTRR